MKWEKNQGKYPIFMRKNTYFYCGILRIFLDKALGQKKIHS